MKKLLSLILSITMLTSVAQLSAFADITAPVGTTEDNPVSVESSLQDETENVAEVTDSEPVLYSTLEQESAKLIKLTAEETGFKLTDSSDSQATANAAAEQTETEPITDDCCGEEEHNHSLPAGITNAIGNMLKETPTLDSSCKGTSFADAINITSANYLFNKSTDYPDFNKIYDASNSLYMPGSNASIGKSGLSQYTGSQSYRHCGTMVPQGFCFADIDDTHKYMLVSAYCPHTFSDENGNLIKTSSMKRPSGDNTYHYSVKLTKNDGKTVTCDMDTNWKKQQNDGHRSVVYVIDRTTNTYITEIILPTYSHVGGIAYDGRYLWIGNNYTPSKSGISNQDLRGQVFNIDFNNLKSKIDSDKTNPVNDATGNYKNCIDLSGEKVTNIYTTLPPDCLSYRDGYLYVGRFTYNNTPYTPTGHSQVAATDSLIAKYKINSNTSIERTGFILAKNCNRLQGFQLIKNKFGKEQLITSSSYVRNDNNTNYISEINIFTSSNNNDTYDTLKKKVTMPPMSEGIAYDSKKERLYATFESAAYIYTGGYSKFGGGAACTASCDKIVALNISQEEIDYDHILDIGNKDSNSEPGKGYEQVILDQDWTFDSIYNVHTGKTVCSPGDKTTSYCYAFGSKVPKGESWLVRLKGNFDITNRCKNTSGGAWVTDTHCGGAVVKSEGFYVQEGGYLEIRNDAGYTVDCRRNTFLGNTENPYYEQYTESFITVERGGTLKIDGSKNKIKITGGNRSKTDGLEDTRGFVPATLPIICSKNAGNETSKQNWYIDGLILDMLNGANKTSTGYYSNAGINPYNAFQNFEMKNCEFYNVRLRKQEKDKNRECAALFFSQNYNGVNTKIENLYFDNERDTLDALGINDNVTANNQLVSFDAIRFDGYSENFELINSKFMNSYSKFGAVGFLNYNKDGYDYAPNNKIGTLNIKKAEFTNCVGLIDDDAKQTYESGNATQLSDSIAHFFGPLTFATTIDDLYITNGVGDTDNPSGATKFTNCTSFHSGGIAFDRNANITNKAVLGSEKQNTTNNRNALIFDKCTGKKNAGAIGIYGKINQLIVGDATINSCKSTNGSAIMIYGSAINGTKAEIADMTLQYTDIRNCSSTELVTKGQNFSGTVRSTGSAACKLTVDHCNITDNYVWKDGGGIYWNAMGTTTNKTKSSLYIKDSVISNNTATESGGGIYCEADITGSTDSGTVTVPGIVNTVISDNEAGKDGGGICQTVYDNSKETSVSLTKTKLALGEKVEINNNLAKGDGGGVAFILRDSANIKDVNAASNYSLTFEISDKGENSAVISNNQAEFYGGGIYYGTGSEITTNDGALGATAQAKINNYTKSINLYAGKINYNKANSHGGGIYSNSGAITFKKGEIDNNEAGAQIVKNKVTLKPAGNGGGGAVFVTNGGSVTVYNGFIRNNKAFKHNSDNKNTAFQGNTYDGVGGGICVANGTGATDTNGVIKRSKFTLTKEATDTEYNVGIYSNEADFSADDVYASGQYTKLEVPKVGVMNLTDYKGKATGWFEDYNNGDTNYAQYGTSLATEGVGSRYRRNIQEYASKYKIPDTATNARTVNEDMITDFVNVNDKYVCMTLGAIASTSITNNIKVPDLDNLGTYKSVSGTPHDVALKYTITRNDGDNFTANDLVFDIDGKKFDPDIANPVSAFSFYLKDGETINFPNMTDGIDISVKVEYVKSTTGETISATGEDISYVAKTDNKVVTDSGDHNTLTNTTSEIITTDGNKIQTFTFNNFLVAVRVKINFFDRNTDKNGTPADIKSKATTYCKDLIASDCEAFFNGKSSKSPIEMMITATGVEVGDKYKNVVDDYHLWSSQTEAEKGIKNFATSNAEYMNLVSKKYSDENNYKFHSNNYGIPTTENWLTYTNVDGTEKKYDDAIKFENGTDNIVNASKEIGQVNVWLFNTPKKYKVNVYEAPENSNVENMTNLNNGKFIFDANPTKTFNAYYNQRIGTETGDPTQDEKTNHLENYDLSGIIKDSSNNPVVLNTAKEIKVGNDTYKFSYWSFDSQGKTVASTNYGYNYRITTDTDLYPVYEKTPMRLNGDNVGVTTTANQIDVFFDNQGVAKTRLNTVINPYNCDDNDSRISHVSAIYIIASKNATVDKSVIDGLKKIIHKYYTDNSVTSLGSMDISTFIDTMKNQNPSLDLTIKNNSGQVVTINRGMYYVYTAEKANLTNKNRTEFTLTFDTSALINRRLLAFTAMKFSDVWKVSDNCYDYSFDVNGAMNDVKNITSVY